METTVYSFADVSFVISHPKVGKFTITGKGVGSVSVSRSNDMTQHDVAADGSTMVSKIDTNNGTIAIAIQQTSAAHKWLKKWHDYLKIAPTSEFAKSTAILKNPSTGENISMSAVTPQKRADSAFQQAGQQVTWNLMAAKISG